MSKFSELLLQLAPMQRRFVEEYLADSTSAQKAARNAGYSETSSGNELLKHPRIKAAIDAGIEEAAKEIGVSRERILRELSKIAFGNIGQILEVDDITRLSHEELAALDLEISFKTTNSKVGENKFIKIKSGNKIQALQLLGKELGMFKDKVEVNANLSLEQLVEQSIKAEESNPV